jgi:D-alanine-D-alanine ligase-like ATP-grasp enzyme
VPAAGHALRLLDSSNLSTGGEARDITDRLDPELGRIAARAARTVGLVLCGVDLIADDATRPSPEYKILEVNGSPGLDNYAALGPAQRQRVESMYRRMLGLLRARGA